MGRSHGGWREVVEVSTDWIVQFPCRKSIRVLQLQLRPVAPSRDLGRGGGAASITTIEEIHDRQKAGNPPILSLIHDLSRPFKLYLTARSVNKLSLAITRVSLLSYFRFGKCAEFSGYYVRIPWIARLSSPLNSRDRRLARNSDTSFK